MSGMDEMYGYGYSDWGLDALFYSVIMFLAGIMLFALIFGLVIWIFRALAVQRIAKRRGISNAWLSWLPVGQDWVVGSISDQYQYLVQGKVRNKRKLLTCFSLGALIISIVNLVYAVQFAWMGINADMYVYDGMITAGTVVGYVVTSLLTIGLVITCYVLRCMAIYNLYRSCEPKNAVVYLVLGIFFVFLEPVFLMMCRNKDFGMPPRRTVDAFAQNPENPLYTEPQDTTYL